nr:BREX-1 system adenine-specific DNA-methyltransferase PglX [Candidatus Tectomicrobia bacterium]
LEKGIDRQEEFVSELRDFEDKLRRAASLHLEPDLNDGVVLNICLIIPRLNRMGPSVVLFYR